MNEQKQIDLQEIETKQRAILEIKRIRKGLNKEEEEFFQMLDKKYRDKNGHLIKGSYIVDSNSKWCVV